MVGIRARAWARVWIITGAHEILKSFRPFTVCDDRNGIVFLIVVIVQEVLLKLVEGIKNLMILHIRLRLWHHRVRHHSRIPNSGLRLGFRLDQIRPET